QTVGACSQDEHGCTDAGASPKGLSKIRAPFSPSGREIKRPAAVGWIQPQNSPLGCCFAFHIQYPSAHRDDVTSMYHPSGFAGILVDGIDAAFASVGNTQEGELFRSSVSK